MNKKYISFVSLVLLIVGAFFSFLFSYTQNSQATYSQGTGEENYSLYFNSSSNKLNAGSGQAVVKTSNNNSIVFSYNGISNNDGWQSMSNSGFFANQDAINGLKNINIQYSSNNSNKLLISFGWGESMDFQEEITSNQTYTFNSKLPPYFRIDNLTGNAVDISSISINYSCSSGIKPNTNQNYLCKIENHKYIIDILNLSVTSLQNAYQHAINLNPNQLFDVDEILINLPGGNEYLDNTISFSGERRNETPIRIKGNNTVFYGGYQLQKGIWSNYSNGIYRAYIGQGLSKFSSLLVNDEAATLAKTNQFSFSYSFSNRKITIKKSSLDLSSLTDTCEFVSLENWAQNIGVVTSISSSGLFTTTQTLNFDQNGDKIFFELTPTYRPSSATSITGYLQDNLAFLDEENEWYYNSGEGYLYYKPINESTINLDSFVIANIETVLETDGLISNVIFDSIGFNGSNFSSPLINGFSETQSSWYYDPTENKNNMISGMVHINSDKTEFVNCSFKNASNASIYIDCKSVDTIIDNNQIINSGAGAMIVGHPSKALIGEIPEKINIANNTINNYGCLYQGAPGICSFYIDRLTINNNSISNGGYSGIAVGWGWLNNQNTYGHNHYRILNNRISNIMNGSLHDGGGIYTLGNFPNGLSEIYNEIIGNYIEINHTLNGGIYLDEGSSSWNVQNNAIKVTGSGSTYHGVIMMHDPIDTLNGTNNSQFANSIVSNYYTGDVDGSENQMQITYENASGVKYTGSELTDYNNSRNIVFDTPIESNEAHVNNAIYDLSGISSEETYPFVNESRFSQMITGYSNLSLDSSIGSASFDVTINGFVISNNYLRDLIKKGYNTLALNINASSLNSVQACYAIITSSGSLSWQVYYSQTELSHSLLIPLNKFDVDGATCRIQIRDVNGLNQDNNLPARVTLSRIGFSIFSPLTTNSTGTFELLYSYKNEFVYQVNDVSYDWKRVFYNNISEAYNKGYSKVKIDISGNNHNLYIFKTDGEQIDYNNMIQTGGGSVIIDLENTSQSIAIMTSHENYNVPNNQDDNGIYGTSENLRISFKFISADSENLLISRRNLSKYFSGLTIHDVSNNTATISFNQYRLRLTHALINEMKNKGVSSVEFDILVPNGSNVKSIVTCWYGGPNNTEVTYSDEGTFVINQDNIIHIKYYSNRFNNAYDMEMVSRDINGYSGVDINLENAVISNFIYNYS